jgi:hypothetical protein
MPVSNVHTDLSSPGIQQCSVRSADAPAALQQNRRWFINSPDFNQQCARLIHPCWRNWVKYVRNFIQAIQMGVNAVCRTIEANTPKGQSAKVSRILSRFHAHKLIAGISHSRRWRVTDRGKRIMAASLCLRDVAFPELFRKNIAA